MRETLSMPKLGESVTEGSVLHWLKPNGARVNVDEAIVEVETEKVNVEITSPWDGVLQIVAQPGEVVPVGQPLAHVETDTPSLAEPRAMPAPAAERASAPVMAERRRTREYSPVVLALAEEHHIDLTQVRGTGIEGRVTRGDVLAHIEASQQKASASMGENATKADEIVPLTPTRRTIAERMLQSAQSIPQAWLMMEADVTGLVQLKALAEAEFLERYGTHLGYLPFIVQTVALALREHRFLNSSWSDGGIVLRKSINIGIATATSSGLVVPNIRDADRLKISELSRVLAGLTERARTQRLTLDDVQGGTFTLDNTGALGSIQSAPIVNPSQAAVLTFEAIVSRPAVRDGQIEIREMANLCLSFDHRIMDGDAAAAFVRDVKQRLEALQEGYVFE